MLFLFVITYCVLCRDDFMYNPRGQGIKKDIQITYKMRCQKIHTKEYAGFGTLYNFMLEQMEDFGAVSVCKFAR